MAVFIKIWVFNNFNNIFIANIGYNRFKRYQPIFDKLVIFCLTPLDPLSLVYYHSCIYLVNT